MEADADEFFVVSIFFDFFVKTGAYSIFLPFRLHVVKLIVVLIHICFFSDGLKFLKGTLFF